jgi:hypothetical protein
MTVRDEEIERDRCIKMEIEQKIDRSRERERRKRKREGQINGGGRERDREKEILQCRTMHTPS